MVLINVFILDQLKMRIPDLWCGMLAIQNVEVCNNLFYESVFTDPTDFSLNADTIVHIILARDAGTV
jgi:hypothetical protein